jgi:signal transduction histidine kinase
MQPQQHKTIIFSFASMILVFLITFFLWMSLKDQEIQHLRETAKEKLISQTRLLMEEFSKSHHGLTQMAGRWNFRGGIPKNEWERDARIQIEIFTGLEAIFLLDSNFNLSWGVTSEGSEESVKEFKKIVQSKKSSLEIVSKDSKGSTVESFAFKKTQYFFIAIPLYKKNQFKAFQIGIARAYSFLDFIFLDDFNDTFSISVLQGNKVLYGLSDPDRPYVKDWSFFQKAEFLGLNWTLQFVPRAPFFEKERSLLPLFVAVFGTIVGILLFTTTYFSLEARKRSIELISANAELETRVDERTAELKLSQAHLIHLEKLSALGKLTGSISHEFNNPLQGIRNAINTISKSPLSEEDAKIASLGIRECDRMAKMIFGLRDFYKPTSDEVSHIDINQCIEEVLLLEKKSLEERNIQINIHFSEKILLVEVVADQIKQVLLNLVQNAADAMTDKGQISLATKKQDSHVIIKIQDTGKGISDDDIKNIFEPFFTTKESEQGTGLGLSISYGIIKDHGGEIEVKSELEEGSIFTIKLPFNSEKKLILF